MRTIILTLCLVAFYKAHCQWSVLNSGSSEWLRNVYFTNIDSGFVVGFNGVILKTTDGGNSWQQKYSGTTSDLQGVFFINDTMGWAVGGGVILKTTDAGENWSMQSPPLLSNFHQVQFLDLNNGYIAGESGVCLKTIDGGNNWVNLQLTTGNGKVGVFFHDINNGFFVGLGYADAIVKTNDGGITWNNVYTNSVAEFSSITFTNNTNGIAATTGGHIAKTSNAGDSWLLQSSPASSLYSLCFPSSEIGYTVGGYPNHSNILKTFNGGSSWSVISSPISSPLFGVMFVDTMIGYAVGENGTIIKTVNGGGINKNSPISESDYVLYPSPCIDYFTISFPNPAGTNTIALLTNNLGQLIKQYNIDEGSSYSQISTYELSSGIYYLSIFTGEEIKITKKISILR